MVTLKQHRVLLAPMLLFLSSKARLPPFSPPPTMTMIPALNQQRSFLLIITGGRKSQQKEYYHDHHVIPSHQLHHLLLLRTPLILHLHNTLLPSNHSHRRVLQLWHASQLKVITTETLVLMCHCRELQPPKKEEMQWKRSYFLRLTPEARVISAALRIRKQLLGRRIMRMGCPIAIYIWVVVITVITRVILLITWIMH